MKKLTCHCGKIEAEVKVPEGGFEKISRLTVMVISAVHYFTSNASLVSRRISVLVNLVSVFKRSTISSRVGDTFNTALPVVNKPKVETK